MSVLTTLPHTFSKVNPDLTDPALGPTRVIRVHGSDG